jgi:2-polyprenyl-3-methyl-5-hydroxy-6-metoxy-1,4-benzoquinol methylase
MIATWSRGPADENMAEDILTRLGGLVRRHPWWQARAKLMLSILFRAGVRPPATVLDAGCGWGVNLDVLERLGYGVDGLDISRRILERLDCSRRTLFEADLTQPLPRGLKQYDAVISLDVIEHVDDDHGVVTRLAELTKPGGITVLSVPALPELFSEYDEVQGHRRRYVPETLQKAVANTGLQIEKMLWWGSWMVPLLRRRQLRRRQKAGTSASEVYRQYLTLPPWPGTWVLRSAFAYDHFRTLRGKTRIGTSLFAVARRASG